MSFLWDSYIGAVYIGGLGVCLCGFQGVGGVGWVVAWVIQ
jgi:hypothetical protein